MKRYVPPEAGAATGVPSGSSASSTPGDGKPGRLPGAAALSAGRRGSTPRSVPTTAAATTTSAPATPAHRRRFLRGAAGVQLRQGSDGRCALDTSSRTHCGTRPVGDEGSPLGVPSPCTGSAGGDEGPVGRGDLLGLGAGEGADVDEPVEHVLLPGGGRVRVPERVVGRRRLEEPGQQAGLRPGEVGWLGAEVALAGGGEAVEAVPVVAVVEVHPEQVVLAPGGVELEREDDGPRAVPRALPAAGVEVLGELLVEGGAALVGAGERTPGGADGADRVDTDVVLEAGVLGGDQRSGEVGRDVALQRGSAVCGELGGDALLSVADGRRDGPADAEQDAEDQDQRGESSAEPAEGCSS